MIPLVILAAAIFLLVKGWSETRLPVEQERTKQKHLDLEQAKLVYGPKHAGADADTTTPS